MSGIVIVGGGLTGLVAAERLHSEGISAIVCEREDEPGGACRSIERDGFIFDHTGHLLHVARPETESYLSELGVWSQLEVHRRAAAVVVGDRVTPYPIQIHTYALAPDVRRECLLGFVRAWAANRADDPEDFADWVLGRFGEGLAEHFFFPYNRKLYRAEPQELTLDWVGRYVPKPDLEEVVDGALGRFEGDIGYNATFRYPRGGGIRRLPDAVAVRVDDLRLSQRVRAIHAGERWIELSDGTRIGYRHLVATHGLPALVDMLVGKVPDEVRAARKQLRWVRVLNLALGVEGPAPRPEHWLYLPDAELSLYRVGFPSNHGRLAPPGCHTVSAEVSLPPGTASVEAAAERAEDDLVHLGWLDRSRVRVHQLTVVDPAYVVFDHPRRSAVAMLRKFLGGCDIMLAGRWAEWKYSAMEDAILDGMRVARRLADAPR